MLTIAQVCDLYAYLYADTIPTPAGTWDFVWTVDGSYAALKRVDGIDYVMWRGSVTAIDWLQDFDLGAIPIHDDKLGWVHPGFVDGVRRIIGWVNDKVGAHVVTVGHSLGAGHAAIYAGYRQADGLPVDQVIMFGEPRAGMSTLATVLENTPIVSYRNMDAHGHDTICDVPPDIPFVTHYQHPRALTDVSYSPPSSDPWGPFKFHHFFEYAMALGASGPAVQAIKPKGY